MSAHPTGRSAADEALLALASSGQVPQEYLGGSGVAPNTEASEHVLQTWRTADCVCFDVGCTITRADGLDLLAEFMGVKDEVFALTQQAKDGTMNLSETLEEVLRIINCTPDDVRRFVQQHPPEKRLTKGIVNLIKTLQKRGVAVYMISGGFREDIMPIAKYLGVPRENVFANRMNWQWDDETGQPTRLSGFDESQPTAFNMGKIRAISKIREDHPYNTVVMIGDGATDMEAVQSSQGADLFIGYGGVVERPAVAEAAEWFVYDHDELTRALKCSKVAMIGIGPFACAAIHLVVQNIEADDQFDPCLKVWVQDPLDEFEGRSLIDIVNTEHHHPKYLPGVHLGDKVIASSDLEWVASDADVLIFCPPHQHMQSITRRLMGKVKREAVAISLVKGMRVGRDGPQLVSQMIRKNLGIDCSVLMGGNVASEIAKRELSEAVVGANSRETGQLFRKLFQTPYFNVDIVQDVAGAEMCGTLKNIVALAVGIVDGLGCGCNAKAVIMRQGLTEMRKLSKTLYPNVRNETFFESCGLGDMITTCLGGRHRATAEAWTRAWKSGAPKTWSQLEVELLSGQKLQGVGTSNEVQEVLRARGWEASYPLFTTVNRIIKNYIPPTSIFTFRDGVILPLPDEDDEELIPTRRTPGQHSRVGSIVSGSAIPAS
uniref:Glycerol-3-phosphate dehydrogenase [NAD(+)] n=1 Tax=Dunaliella salina TaxID=3046 RepID=A0A515EIS9_DUNSA|nr:glycerol-3-phosphate dehydrogenase [Dunaliella salina]